MKRILFAVTMLVLTLSALQRADARTDVSVDFFYTNLATGGTWAEVGNYGYCWQPSVAVTNRSWRPYSDGYWAYTDIGWTWVSYEDFGWATYHYGRWARLRDRGWFWVPGREWGPAWVSWRTGGDYVGWAPLPPRGYDRGEVAYEGRPINGQVDLDFDIGPAYYNFVDIRYIGEPVLRERIFDVNQNYGYIAKTVNVTNITYNNSTVYNYGPDYNTLSAYSSRPIQRLTLQRETGVDPYAAAQSGALTRVQGDKLVVAAPLTLQAPSTTAAPKTVAEKIAQPTIEHGWTGVSDQRTQSQLKEKMKTEDAKSVPPPDFTPKPGAVLAASPNPAPSAGASVNALTAPSPSAGKPVPAGAASLGTAASPATGSPAGPAIAASPATPPSPAMPASGGKGKNKRGENAPPFMTPSPAPNAAGSPAPNETSTPAPRPGRGKRRDQRDEKAPPTPSVGAPDAAANPATNVPSTPPRAKGKERPAEKAQPLMTPAPAPNAAENPELASPREPSERGNGRKGRRPDMAPAIAPAPDAPSNAPEAPPAGKRKGDREHRAERAPDAPPVPAAPETAVGRPQREAPPEVAPQPRRMPPERVAPPQPAAENPAPRGPQAQPEQGRPEKGPKHKKGEPEPSPTAP